MTNLTRDEQVWLTAYRAHANDSELQVKQLAIYADAVLALFQSRFPPSPPPQKESLSGVAPDECNHRLIRSSCILCPPVEADKPKGVYVTREMLADAWNERVWQPHQQGGIGSTLRSEAFKLFCKDLGLSE